MDLATLIGLIVGATIIFFAMLSGTDISMYVNVPGLMIVLGGTFAATLIKFPIVDSYHAFILALNKAFWEEAEKPAELIKTARRLADVARKKSVLALENEEIANEFFQKGIQLCVDGRTPEFVQKVLIEEMDKSIERHEMGEQIFRSIGDAAPAFGMIGTLVGLVQMLSDLDDPSTIGPAMAIALLTTLYGALIANLIAIPIADKLAIRSQQERIKKTIILQSVLSILRGEHPRIMDELLEAYVPTKLRKEDQANGSEELLNKNKA